MELKVYNKLCFYEDFQEFEKECFHRLTNYHWESDPPYRPDTYFKMGVIGDDLVTKHWVNFSILPSALLPMVISEVCSTLAFPLLVKKSIYLVFHLGLN